MTIDSGPRSGDALASQQEGSAKGAFEVSPSGHLLTANRALANMLGYPSPEALIAVSSDFGEQLCPDPELRREFRQLLEQHAAVESFEIPANHKDGEVRWLSVSARAVRDSNGVILGFKGTVRDITERKRVEEAHVTSIERFRALVENSTEEIAVFDADMKPVYVSPSVTRELGRDPIKDGAGFAGLATVHPDDLDIAHSLLRESLSKPEIPVPFQLRQIRDDGSFRWIEGVATNLLEQPRVEGIVINYHDVTSRKEAEMEHQRLSAELLQAQKMEAVGKLAGGVAHNFNNLLTAIGGYAQLVLERLPDDSELRADVEEIDKATKRAAMVARSLLAFSRRRISCREELDVNGIVSDIEALLSQLIGDRTIIETQLEPALPSIEGDRSQLEQVIVNLALNAHDAMPDGGTLTIETASVATVASPEPEGYVTLSIRDTGIGMDEETRAKIFQPFFTTKDDHGTGLGLSTVQAIVEEAGGRITVESQPNEGTTFVIYLPAR